MSVSVGSMSAGLGLDMSEFQRGMQRATEVARSNSTLMSASMKQSAREGAESLRLIDEAIGVHISRPLARILTQEFPGLATGLQAVLGVGVAGALTAVGIEAFDKVSGKIKDAEKAQEEFANASLKAAQTVTTVLGDLQNKLADISGDHKLKFSLQGAEEAKRAIDQIAAAMDAAQKAGEKTQSWGTRAWAWVGEMTEDIGRGAARTLDELYSPTTHPSFFKDSFFDTTQVENMKAALKDMRTDLDIALNSDAAKGTHEALALLANDIKAATGYLDDMKKAGDSAGESLARSSLEFFQNAQKAADLSQKIAAAGAAKDAAAAEDAAHKELVKDAQEDLAAWNGVSNALWQVAAMAEKLGDTALTSAAARLKEFQNINGPIPGSTVAPRFFALPNTASDQLAAFGKDFSAQQQVLSKAVDDAMTPLEREQLTVGKLAIAFAQLPPSVLATVEAQQAFMAALKEASSQETEAELHLHKLQEELQKLLEQSTSAGAGIHAFFKQLQIDASENGKFAFDLLTQALHGFNDEVAKGILTGKAQWKDYARQLDEMALKFALTKTESGIFQQIGQTGFGKSLSGLFGTAGNTAQAQFSGSVAQFAAAVEQFAATAGTSGFGGGLPGAAVPSGIAPPGLPNPLNLPPGAFAAMPDLFSSSAASSVSSGIVPAGMPDFMNLPPDAFAPAPAFASGGDFDMTPGGSMWVGEQGPELLRFGARASGTVVPNSAFGGGDSHTHHNYFDLRGADPAAVQKLYRMLPLVERSAAQRAINTVSEVKRRSRS
jgi:hypothetical protein